MKFEPIKNQKCSLHTILQHIEEHRAKPADRFFNFLFDHDCGELFVIFRSCLLCFVLTCTFASQPSSRCGVALEAVIAIKPWLACFVEINMNQLYQNQVPENWRLKANSMMLGPGFFSPGMCPKNPPCKWLHRSTIHQYLPSFQCQWPPTSSRNCILAGDGSHGKVFRKFHGTFVEFPDFSDFTSSFSFAQRMLMIFVAQLQSDTVFLTKGCIIIWEVIGLGVSEMTFHFPPLNHGTACHTHCDDLKGKKLSEVPWLVLGRRHFFYVFVAQDFSASIRFSKFRDPSNASVSCSKSIFLEGLGFLILRHIQLVSFRKKGDWRMDLNMSTLGVAPRNSDHQDCFYIFWLQDPAKS